MAAPLFVDLVSSDSDAEKDVGDIGLAPFAAAAPPKAQVEPRPSSPEAALTEVDSDDQELEGCNRQADENPEDAFHEDSVQAVQAGGGSESMDTLGRGWLAREMEAQARELEEKAMEEAAAAERAAKRRRVVKQAWEEARGLMGESKQKELRYARAVVNKMESRKLAEFPRADGSSDEDIKRFGDSILKETWSKLGWDLWRKPGPDGEYAWRPSKHFAPPNSSTNMLDENEDLMHKRIASLIKRVMRDLKRQAEPTADEVAQTQVA